VLCSWGENSCLRRPETLPVAAEIKGSAVVQADGRENTEGFRNLRQVTRLARQRTYRCKQTARRFLTKTGVISCPARHKVIQWCCQYLFFSHFSVHQSLQQQTTLVKVSLPEVTVADHSSMDTSTSLDLQATLTQHTEVKTVILQPLAAAVTTVLDNCEIFMDNTDSVFSRTEKSRSKERLEQI